MAAIFGRRDALYITPALLFSGVAGHASELTQQPIRTAWIHGIEGDTVALFQQYTHPSLTLFFVGVYLVAYPALLLLTYLGLKRVDREAAVDYVITYTTVVVASIPLFYLLPVGVTGYYLSSVDPLLYGSNGFISAFMTSVDTLQKAFPSLHAGLSVTASLYAPAGYERLSWTVTAIVVLATLYLGVHWLSDLVAGAAIAYLCYLLTPGIRRLLHAWRDTNFRTPVQQ